MGKDDRTSTKTDSTFAPGDRVAWNTTQGESTGFIRKRLMERTRVHDHEVATLPDNPAYLEVSHKSGAEAPHKPGASCEIAKQGHAVVALHGFSG